MTGVAAAIYQKLVSDSSVAAAVSTYLGRPAIFAVSPVPREVAPPFITIDETSDAGDGDSLDETEHRRVDVDVRFWWPVSGSAEPIEDMGDRARDLLHHKPMALADGWTVKRVIASRLVQIPADAERYPALMSVRVDVTRKVG